MSAADAAKRRGRWLLGLRLLVMFGLLAWVLSRVDLEVLARHFRQARVAPLLAGVSLGFVVWVVSSFKWQRLLRTAGVRRGLFELFQLNLSSLAYGLALPGQVSGEVLKALRLAARLDRRAVAATSVLLDRVTGTAGLAIVGIAGLTFGAPLPLDAGAPPLLALGLLVLAVAFAALLTPRLLGRHARLREWLKSAGLHPGAGWVVSAVALATVAQAIAVAAVWCLARAVDVDVSPMTLAWVFAAVSLLQAVPISIAGVGVREVSFVALLGLYDIPASQALTLSLATFGLQLALASAGWALDVIIGRGPDVQMKPQHADTRSFYDEYWPANVPDSSRTREHVLGLLPDREFERVLDAGCGTGVCSLALSERGREITALDLSAGSLRTARALAGGRGRANVRCVQASLLAQPFADATFDLAFSWGVIHHTPDPIRALDELVRTLRPGGTLVLAVYLRTGLTWLHEAIRWVCLRSPDAVRRAILAGFAGVVRVGERLGKVDEVRADNPRIESQVEDWFFVPEKHFFGIEEMRRLIEDRGLEFELLVEKTGRFRSSSNFIVRGAKPT